MADYADLLAAENQKKPEQKPQKTTSASEPVPARQLPAKPVVKSAPARPFIKRTFDIFEDQVDYIFKKWLQEKSAGKDASMSAWVREAIDQWIAKQKSSK